MGKVELNTRLLKKESNHIVVTSTNCKVQGTASCMVANIRINPWMIQQDCDDLLMTS